MVEEMVSCLKCHMHPGWIHVHDDIPDMEEIVKEHGVLVAMLYSREIIREKYEKLAEKYGSITAGWIQLHDLAFPWKRCVCNPEKEKLENV